MPSCEPGDLGTSLRNTLTVGAGVAGFFGNQALGVTLPVILVSRPGGGALDVGAVAAIGTLGAVVGRFVVVLLVLRVDASRLGALSLLLISLLSLGYPVLAESVIGLAALRGLHGAVFAVATTALYVAVGTAMIDASPARSMALANLAMPTSLLVAPLVALELLDAALAPVSVVAAGVSVMGAIAYLAGSRPQDRHTTQPVPRVTAAAARPSTLAGIIHLPPVLLATAAVLGATDAVLLDHLPGIATMRGIEGFGWSFAVLATAVVATLWALARCAPSGNQLLLVSGSLTLASALVSLIWAGALAVLLVVVVAFGVGFAMLQTGVNASAAGVDPMHRTRGLAVILLSFDVGRAAGVYLVGAAIDGFGTTPALSALAGLLVVIAARLLIRRARPTHLVGAPRS